MYDFYYEYLCKNYKVRLLGTDTDSLQVYLESLDGKPFDIYQDMLKDRHRFDLSEYDPQGDFGFMYDSTNKKVKGLMKDVTAKTGVITEIVFVKSKMYSYVTNKEVEIKDKDGKPTGKKEFCLEMKAKGIDKSFMKHRQRFESYKTAIFSNVVQPVTATKIRFYKHKLHTVKIKKTGLHGIDDKRYMLDNINSIPYGHPDISKINSYKNINCKTSNNNTENVM